MRARKKVSARPTVERHSNPGNAADYITHDGIRPGDCVVLYCRVSTRQQNGTGNLVAQERYLRAEVAARGAIVVGVVTRTESGFNPVLVARAAAIAKPHNAKIVAVSADRLVRHWDFKSTGAKYERNARANAENLEDLKRDSDGVELVTLVDPSAPLSECMAILKKIGQQIKGRRGGRPRTVRAGHIKERRQRCQPEVARLRAEGKSIREIARIVGVPTSTVHRWV